MGHGSDRDSSIATSKRRSTQITRMGIAASIRFPPTRQHWRPTNTDSRISRGNRLSPRLIKSKESAVVCVNFRKPRGDPLTRVFEVRHRADPKGQPLLSQRELRCRPATSLTFAQRLVLPPTKRPDRWHQGDVTAEHQLMKGHQGSDSWRGSVQRTLEIWIKWYYCALKNTRADFCPRSPHKKGIFKIPSPRSAAACTVAAGLADPGHGKRGGRVWQRSIQHGQDRDPTEQARSGRRRTDFIRHTKQTADRSVPNREAACASVQLRQPPRYIPDPN